MTRTKAAAVLTALEQGAPGIPEAYGAAAQATSSPVEAVAAESQAEVIGAACRLREYGVSEDDAVTSMAQLTGAPPQAIRALVAQRWKGKHRGVDRRTDPRQRYQRCGVIAPLSVVDACNAALAAAWAEPLSDPRGGGRQPHPLHAQCLADNAAMLNRPLYKDGALVGMGMRISATPPDVQRLRRAAQSVFAIFVEPQPGADSSEQGAATAEAYEAAVSALGWTTTGPEEVP